MLHRKWVQNSDYTIKEEIVLSGNITEKGEHIFRIFTRLRECIIEKMQYTTDICLLNSQLLLGQYSMQLTTASMSQCT